MPSDRVSHHTSESWFSLCNGIISWMTEHGRLEAKENLTEDKVPMLTAVQLFTGERGHFHALCSLERWRGVGAVRENAEAEKSPVKISLHLGLSPPPPVPPAGWAVSVL
ncbi:hypothetical protein INR49_009800 [Caranx melampygus]|nr:hypothetical protein INR49_009800 [Caranx melampygus]